MTINKSIGTIYKEIIWMQYFSYFWIKCIFTYGNFS